MDQLRTTFIVGTATGLTAQEIFTDRVGEFDAFRRALKRVLEIQADAPSPNLDVGVPRRNVIVYYGLGGIGKTALSKQLERYLNSPELQDQVPQPCAAIRWDFGESGEFDLEAMLLRIRAGLSRIARKWPAFDLAYSLYWERNHPGDPLPGFILRNSVFRHHADRADLGEQIQNTLAEVLQELGQAWAPSRIATRIFSLTHDRLSRSSTYRRIARDCPFFEPIVTADPSAEALGYMPSLLAWQLDSIAQRRPVLPVIFMDTFEAISDRDSREMERQVQRLVFLMPTVLFVITSRNRLDWAELPHTRELDYVGIHRWPQLHLTNTEKDPRQHLVGVLSREDCDSYLKGVLRNPDGQPTLDASLRTRIIEGSEGLPLYLDLSVTQYLEQSAIGRPIRLEEFGGPLSSVVTRIMRNLNAEQRNILRGVSLLDAFDIDLARAASGGSDATLNRFVNSSLVVNTSELSWPYALHAQLRRTIQETDDQQRDAWSAREWRIAAKRIANHLGCVCESGQERRNRYLVVACFSQAVRLGLKYDFVPIWSLEAAQFLADVGSWQALDVRHPRAQASPAGSALTSGLRGIVLRRVGSLEDSVTEFDQSLSSVTLDQATRDLFTLHRTHSLRNSGQYRQAQLEYERMVADGGPFAERARLQLADIGLLRGEFIRVLEDLEESNQSPDALGELLRIRGHVYRVNCRLEEAELTYRHVLDLARRINSAALEGKALTNIAETLCWYRATDAVRLAEQAIEFNLVLGNQLEVLKAHVAKAIASESEDWTAAIEEALQIAESSRYRAGRIFALVGQLICELTRSSDSDDPTRAMLEISSIAADLGVYHYWGDIARWWLGAVGLSYSPESIERGARPDWLDGAESARRRWVSVLIARRE